VNESASEQRKEPALAAGGGLDHIVRQLEALEVRATQDGHKFLAHLIGMAVLAATDMGEGRAFERERGPVRP